MADTFLINNIAASIVSETATITGRASLSPNKMKIQMDGTQLEDFTKGIANQEIQSQANIDFIRGIVLDVLTEQGLI